MLTFRHSGESVRPHVTHTYCSVGGAFFWLCVRTAGQCKEKEAREMKVTFFFFPGSSSSSALPEAAAPGLSRWTAPPFDTGLGRGEMSSAELGP